MANKRNRLPDGDNNGSVANVLVYGVVLGYFMFTVAVDRWKLNAAGSGLFKNEAAERAKAFKHCFFTAWNFKTLTLVIEETLKTFTTMSKARPALLLHLAVLLYYVFSLKKTQDLRETIDFDRMVFHLRKLERYQNITKEQAERYFDEGKYAGLLFFTVWNFALQIMFLILAVADEAAKLAKLTKIQRRCEAYRQFLFATLVLPSSLLVMTIFWVIWHIDRELIFPKAVDDFYPPWLNHTLHTAIAIPLIVEVAIQLNNKNNYYRISRMYAAMTIAIYCTIYQSLYLSVYIQHGIWLYPIYTVFTWAQRVAFVLMQFTLILIYQQVGISLLASREQPKIKGT